MLYVMISLLRSPKRLFFLVLWVGLIFSLRAEMPGEAKGFAGSGLHLYPLGWSPEGHWGALIGNSSGAEPFIFMLILDAVTDEEVYRSGKMEWKGPEGFTAFWKRYGLSVEKKAQSFKLDLSSRPDVREARFVTGGAEYNFVLKPPSPAEGPYVLSIKSSRSGSKAVYTSPVKTAPHRSFLLGALVSPFEARALAVIREMPRYGKGVPAYRFSGAHLTQGFSISPAGGESPASGTGVSAAAARGSLVSAVFNGQEYLVRARLAAGANPDSRDKRGYTALLIASRLGYWTMVDDLLAAGASPLPRDKDGRSALHYAAFAGQAEAVKALLKAGASRTQKDKAGRTPGELAARPDVKNLLQ